MCCHCHRHRHCSRHRLWMHLIATGLSQKLHVLQRNMYTDLPPVYAYELFGQYGSHFYFFPTPAAPSCLLNHGTYIFKYSSALVPVLSTQKEPSHCNIYSLIYRHFFNLSNVELTNSYLSKLHMKPSLFALRFL